MFLDLTSLLSKGDQILKATCWTKLSKWIGCSEKAISSWEVVCPRNGVVESVLSSRCHQILLTGHVFPPQWSICLVIFQRSENFYQVGVLKPFTRGTQVSQIIANIWGKPFVVSSLNVQWSPLSHWIRRQTPSPAIFKASLSLSLPKDLLFINDLLIQPRFTFKRVQKVMRKWKTVLTKHWESIQRKLQENRHYKLR